MGLNALGSASSSPNDPTGNVAIGHDALTTNINQDHNTAVGFRSLANHGGLDPAGTGENVAVGARALEGQTNGYQNTAVGFEAAYSNQSGHQNVAIGYQTLHDINFNGDDNTVVGAGAGFNVDTGDKNSLFGFSAGSSLTTGSKNVIIGSYNGNENGLDIRTSDNNIVLSDGDGNVRFQADSNGKVGIGLTSDLSQTSNSGLSGTALSLKGTTAVLTIQNDDADPAQTALFKNTVNFHRKDGAKVGGISIHTSAVSYSTSSDYRLKENVADMSGAIARVKQLAPKRFNFIVDANNTVDGFLAHEAQTVVPEAVHGTHNEVDDDGNAVMQGIDQSKLVPLLTGALKEAIAKIETLETKVAALEAGS